MPIVFFCKIRALKKIKAQKLTREDDSLTDTATYPVLNAYKVLLLNVETFMLSWGPNICSTLHKVDDKRLKRIQYYCFWSLKVKENFSRKDASKDHTDGPPPPLQNLKKLKLFRPESIKFTSNWKWTSDNKEVDIVKSIHHMVTVL